MLTLQAGEATKEYDIIRPDIGIMARVRRALQHGVVIASQQKCVNTSRRQYRLLS
jgi:hypothetical protein